jgi:hypothetical protein
MTFSHVKEYTVDKYHVVPTEALLKGTVKWELDATVAGTTFVGDV